MKHDKSNPFTRKKSVNYEKNQLQLGPFRSSILKRIVALQKMSIIRCVWVCVWSGNCSDRDAQWLELLTLGLRREEIRIFSSPMVAFTRVEGHRNRRASWHATRERRTHRPVIAAGRPLTSLEKAFIFPKIGKMSVLFSVCFRSYAAYYLIP